MEQTSMKYESKYKYFFQENTHTILTFFWPPCAKDKRWKTVFSMQSVIPCFVSAAYAMFVNLPPNRRQAVIWINADLIHWRIYVALGGDELTNPPTEINRSIAWH